MTSDYDDFSTDYDRFVSWPGRLAYELPFIEQHLRDLSHDISRPVRVLDSACGTGMHAIALAQHGFLAAGADLSAGMAARAEANAAAAGVTAGFHVAGFGELERSFHNSPLYPFDAVLCLGNSLPHLLTARSLDQALVDFHACIRPGGLLLVQNRNFDSVMARRERWMEPQSHAEGSTDWVFLRFYDYESDEQIVFNIVTLRREAGGSWQQSVTTTHLRPLLEADLSKALQQAGFKTIQTYGDMKGGSFKPDESGNLIVTAWK